MALKTTEITIGEDGGRDAGKQFLLTELPALQAEKWAARAFNGLARANVEIPDTVVGAGIVGVWVMGIKMLFAMDFAICSDLMDEMIACVQFRPDPANPSVMRPLVGKGAAQGDVEEVATLKTLREEVFRLHVNFTPAELLQKLTLALNPGPSSNTEMSPDSSAQ